MRMPEAYGRAYAAPVQRIAGVDVARGLAVLGMVAAHVGDATEPGAGWLLVTHGRSAATFATLAGVSVGLLSGGRTPTGLPRAAVRVLVRAVLLAGIGAALVALRTPVAVILPGYALMFLLLVPALWLRRRALLLAAALVLAAGPPVWLAVAVRPDDPPASLLVGEFYPAVVWMAYLLVGLAIGRSDLRDRRTRATLVVGGSALVVVGYGAGLLAARLLPVGSPARAALDVSPHANTAAEVLGNLGVVGLLLTACLVLAERLPALSAPLAATGALALTAYCAHVVAIAVLVLAGQFRPSTGLLAVFVLVLVGVCWAWRVRWGRGPLERVLHAASTATAQVLTPGPAPRR